MLDEEQEEDISPEAARKVMGLSKEEISEDAVLLLIDLTTKLLYNEDMLINEQNKDHRFM